MSGLFGSDVSVFFDQSVGVQRIEQRQKEQAGGGRHGDQHIARQIGFVAGSRRAGLFGLGC